MTPGVSLTGRPSVGQLPPEAKGRGDRRRTPWGCRWAHFLPDGDNMKALNSGMRVDPIRVEILPLIDRRRRDKRRPPLRGHLYAESLWL